MKVLIAAGGTAGHVMPALRVAEELRQRDASNKIIFVTTRKKQDIDLVRSKNFGVKSILAGKFRRYFSLLNFVDPFFVFIGFVQSLIIIIKFRPNIIFSKGGYLSLPVVVAGRILFRKIVVHESDLEMGVANRIAAFFANKVLVSFPKENYSKIKTEKLVYTGNPIRKISYNAKLENDNTVLVMG
ncbi:UDP-N-acetylglucosamine--N-acetylmuramyl-(pentapeptide) pyrophosphoryl-undecaprenol N-acetylglucosamine transferase, partial [bacterium]|nr:UDP-N-acetylglucosamine--N-acetylmuramyl-(pentapeptide) pyrophosphoryl-undecaprenol N-acetylglucosamine transferase [bacterium]